MTLIQERADAEDKKQIPQAIDSLLKKEQQVAEAEDRPKWSDPATLLLFAAYFSLVSVRQLGRCLRWPCEEK